jgi:hypothetical protein
VAFVTIPGRIHSISALEVIGIGHSLLDGWHQIGFGSDGADDPGDHEQGESYHTQEALQLEPPELWQLFKRNGVCHVSLSLDPRVPLARATEACCVRWRSSLYNIY